VDIGFGKPKKRRAAWQHALDSHYDTLLMGGKVPRRFHEQIAQASEHGVLTVHAQHTARASNLFELLNAGLLRRDPLYRAVDTVLSHHPVRSNCVHCTSTDTLDQSQTQWLEKLRTPAAENVVGWLLDGNTDQFVKSHGCEKCFQTGAGDMVSVYEMSYREQKSNLFAVGQPKDATEYQVSSLQKNLMKLAKAGTIPLSEVIRVLGNNGSN